MSMPDRQKELPKADRSWWIDAPREGMTATAYQEVPRMRYGVSFYREDTSQARRGGLMKKLREPL